MHRHEPERVSSLDIPALKPYRTLRRPQDHIERGIFVAEGGKVVRRLLESDLEIVSFLLTEEWYATLLREDERFRSCSAAVFLAEKDLLLKIVGYRLHQGIMAIGKVPRTLSIADCGLPTGGSSLLVALDGLMNSENVGVIVRNCAGFGVKGILVGGNSSSPYLRRAVRNSMGAVFRMPVIHAENLAASLRVLREHGMKIIAADAGEGTSLERADLGGNVCIVLGNEEAGISRDVLGICDQRVHISMQGEIDSLNVSSASAVLLYEARRQHG